MNYKLDLAVLVGIGIVVAFYFVVMTVAGG